MATRRVARLSQAILETVSTTVLFQMRDPRIKNVTVLRVEVSGDLRSAKVYVSVRGDKKHAALTLKGLNAARGFVQSKVADRIQTRYTPVLTFVLEEDRAGVITEAEEILKQLAAERGESDADESLADRGDDEPFADSDPDEEADAGDEPVAAEVDYGDDDDDSESDV